MPVTFEFIELVPSKIKWGRVRVPIVIGECPIGIDFFNLILVKTVFSLFSCLT